MGRWAQRRLGGGGSRTLNVMIAAIKTDGQQLTITYANPVTQGTLDDDAFKNEVADTFSVSVAADGSNIVVVNFTDPIGAPGQVTYLNPTIGFLNPQTIPFT